MAYRVLGWYHCSEEYVPSKHWYHIPEHTALVISKNIKGSKLLSVSMFYI